MVLIKIFILFLTCCRSYKELGLTRTKLGKSINQRCSEHDASTHQIYHEICYYKDVNYYTQIYIDESIYYVSMDLTAPISWLKSPACKDTKKINCHIIQDLEKIKAQNQFKDVKANFNMFGRKHKDNLERDVAIMGSSDLIIGSLENITFAQFYAKDSNNVKELTKLIGVSLFLTPYKDKISIQNVSFIEAEKLSSDVNEMIDGSISLRPNKESRSTLMDQLFLNSQNSHKIITIFIHPLSQKGVISVGDISYKNVRSRSSQIVWIPMKDNPKFGHFCPSIGIGIKDAKGIISSESVNKNIYFTVSSTCIFLPKDLINWIISQFQQKTNSFCQIEDESGILRCEWQKIQQKKKILFLQLQFALTKHSQAIIPIITLINISNHNYIQFTIKQSISSDKIILGEPFFEKYVLFINYMTFQIAFEPSLYHQSEKFTNILIYFLRFILFLTIILFLAYMFFKPINKFYRFINRKFGKDKKKKINSQVRSFDQLPEADFYQ